MRMHIKTCASCQHVDLYAYQSPCKECIETLGTCTKWEAKTLENKNRYWERIEAIATEQREKGLSKYGQGLEMNPAALGERIRHLEEELIDGLMYCEWIKEKLLELGDNNGT